MREAVDDGLLEVADQGQRVDVDLVLLERQFHRQLQSRKLPRRPHKPAAQPGVCVRATQPKY